MSRLLFFSVRISSSPSLFPTWNRFSCYAATDCNSQFVSRPPHTRRQTHAHIFMTIALSTTFLNFFTLTFGRRNYSKLTCVLFFCARVNPMACNFTEPFSVNVWLWFCCNSFARFPHFRFTCCTRVHSRLLTKQLL